MNALDNLVSGAVRCIFSSAPLATLKSLLAWGKTRPDGERMAVCEVDLSQPTYEIIDNLIRSLANAALAVWPDWYDCPNLLIRCDEASLQSALDRLASRGVAGSHRSVLRPWVLRAIPMCRLNTPPVVSDISHSVQLQQLSLAIANNDITLLVRPSPDSDPEPTSLLAFGKNLEWLSRQVSACVVVVLPASWFGRPELDCISWEYRTVDDAEHTTPEAESSLDEPLAMVCPIRGRPHPNSPGEQLMASRLGCDPVLGTLFEYNKLVTTVRDSRYQVDLVWFDGKIVVEIDGYRCHSSRFDFANDRQRDYELQLSGYLVLRLTHDSVMTDVELAIDKVRDLVKLRTHQPLPTRPSV
jgi:very-short-patch-repair endonuclease